MAICLRVGDACPECGAELMGIAAHSVSEIEEKYHPRWRMSKDGFKCPQAGLLPICPACDAYALGLDRDDPATITDIEGRPWTVQNLEAREPGRVVSALDILGRSPLFQLSLASKELFHSNMLAYLFKTFPDEMEEVVGRIMGAERPGKGLSKKAPPAVFRERNNLDLEIEFQTGDALVIELKIKSIPDRKQLDSYAEKIAPRAGRTTCWLVSLTPPDFFAGGTYKTVGPNGKSGPRTEITWHFVEFGQLVRFAREHIRPDDPYMEGLIGDYASFALALAELGNSLGLKLQRGTPFFLGEALTKRLQELRIHDWVQKMRCQQLASELRRNLGPSVAGAEGWNGPAGTSFTSSGLTRGVGLCEGGTVLYGKGDKRIILGFQLQGRQFRLFAAIKGIADDQSGMAVHEKLWHSKDWFDVETLADTHPQVLEDARMRDTFCRYGSNFSYRYALVRQDADIMDVFAIAVEQMRRLERLSPDITKLMGDLA